MNLNDYFELSEIVTDRLRELHRTAERDAASTAPALSWRRWLAADQPTPGPARFSISS